MAKLEELKAARDAAAIAARDAAQEWRDTADAPAVASAAYAALAVAYAADVAYEAELKKQEAQQG